MEGQSLDDLYDEAFPYMERWVHELAGLVPAPQLVNRSGLRVFRFLEQTPDQAIVQKLARLVSALRAARVLLDRGFVQEVGILMRVLDETQQDVVFVLSGLKNPTDLDREFLEAFYEEEFDADTAVASTQRRKMIPRKKIRARIAKFFSELPGSRIDQSSHAEGLRKIDKTQSGYVHGASGHLMEMYGGRPPQFCFHMNGIAGTSVEQVRREEFWYYVYRSIMVFAMAVYRFRGDEGSDTVWAYANSFAQSKPGSSRTADGSV